MQFTITGQVYSKANSRRMVIKNNHPLFIKSDKALQYEEVALWQLKTIVARHKPFIVPVAVEITIFYPDHRQDLDPSLILDVMQKAGIYKNDRLVEEMHLFRQIDKLNPRAEIMLWKIGE